MTITVKYLATGKPAKRYVRKAVGARHYEYCKQSVSGFDVEQGTCDVEDLPLDISVKCNAYKGPHYACEWPLNEVTHGHH